jgi:hypothetical protein
MPVVTGGRSRWASPLPGSGAGSRYRGDMISVLVAARRALGAVRPIAGMSTALPMIAALLFGAPANAAVAAPPTVHSVCDISHEFTFYLDGRFHRQYLADHGRDARNWGTLHKLDLSNSNLLVLVGGNERVPYADASVEHVAAFVERDGGTVLLMIDGGDPMPPGEAVARRFGAMPTTDRACPPLQGMAEVPEETEIEFRRGTVLALEDPTAWTVLVEDAEGRPVLAARRAGAGHVIVGSRGLFGQKPDASDPINASWITPMLVGRAEQKPIAPIWWRSPASSRRRA